MAGFNEQQIIQIIPQYSVNSTCYVVKCSMAVAPESPVFMCSKKAASEEIPTKFSTLLEHLNAEELNSRDVMITVGAQKDTVDKGENVNRKSI